MILFQVVFFFFFFFYYGTKYGLRLLGFFVFFFAYEYPVILAPLVEKTALTLIILCQKSIICSCVGLFLDSAFISTLPQYYTILIAVALCFVVSLKMR